MWKEVYFFLKKLGYDIELPGTLRIFLDYAREARYEETESEKGIERGVSTYSLFGGEEYREGGEILELPSDIADPLELKEEVEDVVSVYVSVILNILAAAIEEITKIFSFSKEDYSMQILSDPAVFISMLRKKIQEVIDKEIAEVIEREKNSAINYYVKQKIEKEFEKIFEKVIERYVRDFFSKLSMERRKDFSNWIPNVISDIKFGLTEKIKNASEKLGADLGSLLTDIENGRMLFGRYISAKTGGRVSGKKLEEVVKAIEEKPTLKNVKEEIDHLITKFREDFEKEADRIYSKFYSDIPLKDYLFSLCSLFLLDHKDFMSALRKFPLINQPHVRDYTSNYFDIIEKYTRSFYTREGGEEYPKFLYALKDKIVNRLANYISAAIRLSSEEKISDPGIEAQINDILLDNAGWIKEKVLSIIKEAKINTLDSELMKDKMFEEKIVLKYWSDKTGRDVRNYTKEIIVKVLSDVKRSDIDNIVLSLLSDVKKFVKNMVEEQKQKAEQLSKSITRAIHSLEDEMMTFLKGELKELLEDDYLRSRLFGSSNRKILNSLEKATDYSISRLEERVRELSFKRTEINNVISRLEEQERTEKNEEKLKEIKEKKNIMQKRLDKVNSMIKTLYHEIEEIKKIKNEIKEEEENIKKEGKKRPVPQRLEQILRNYLNIYENWGLQMFSPATSEFFSDLFVNLKLLDDTKASIPVDSKHTVVKKEDKSTGAKMSELKVFEEIGKRIIELPRQEMNEIILVLQKKFAEFLEKALLKHCKMNIVVALEGESIFKHNKKNIAEMFLDWASQKYNINKREIVAVILHPREVTNILSKKTFEKKDRDLLWISDTWKLAKKYLPEITKKLWEKYVEAQKPEDFFSEAVKGTISEILNHLLEDMRGNIKMYREILKEFIDEALIEFLKNVFTSYSSEKHSHTEEEIINYLIAHSGSLFRHAANEALFNLVDFFERSGNEKLKIFRKIMYKAYADYSKKVVVNNLVNFIFDLIADFSAGLKKHAYDNNPPQIYRGIYYVILTQIKHNIPILDAPDKKEVLNEILAKLSEILANSILFPYGKGKTHQGKWAHTFIRHLLSKYHSVDVGYLEQKAIEQYVIESKAPDEIYNNVLALMRPAVHSLVERFRTILPRQEANYLLSLVVREFILRMQNKFPDITPNLLNIYTNRFLKHLYNELEGIALDDNIQSYLYFVKHEYPLWFNYLTGEKYKVRLPMIKWKVTEQNDSIETVVSRISSFVQVPENKIKPIIILSFQEIQQLFKGNLQSALQRLIPGLNPYVSPDQLMPPEEFFKKMEPVIKKAVEDALKNTLEQINIGWKLNFENINKLKIILEEIRKGTRLKEFRDLFVAIADMVWDALIEYGIEVKNNRNDQNVEIVINVFKNFYGDISKEIEDKIVEKLSSYIAIGTKDKSVYHQIAAALSHHFRIPRDVFESIEFPETIERFISKVEDSLDIEYDEERRNKLKKFLEEVQGEVKKTFMVELKNILSRSLFELEGKKTEIEKNELLSKLYYVIERDAEDAIKKTVDNILKGKENYDLFMKYFMPKSGTKKFPELMQTFTDFVWESIISYAIEIKKHRIKDDIIDLLHSFIDKHFDKDDNIKEEVLNKLVDSIVVKKREKKLTRDTVSKIISRHYRIPKELLEQNLAAHTRDLLNRIYPFANQIDESEIKYLSRRYGIEIDWDTIKENISLDQFAKYLTNIPTELALEQVKMLEPDKQKHMFDIISDKIIEDPEIQLFIVKKINKAINS